MKIEIVFDPVCHAAEYGMVLGEDHEILPDGEWIRWARRFSGIEDLFVYRHKKTGNFVLSKWIYHPERDGVGIVMELEAFPAPLDWFPPTQEWFRNRIRPAQSISDSIKKGIRDKARREHHEKRDQIEEKHRVADWLKSQGHEESAAMTRNRRWSANDSPEFEEFKKDLNNKAKGRIITGGV